MEDFLSNSEILISKNDNLGVDLFSCRQKDKIVARCKKCSFRIVTTKYAMRTGQTKCKRCISVWNSGFGKKLRAELLSPSDYDNIPYPRMDSSLKIRCSKCNKVSKRRILAFKKTFEKTGEICGICFPSFKTINGELLKENHPQVIEHMVSVPKGDVFFATTKEYDFRFKCGHVESHRPISVYLNLEKCFQCRKMLSRSNFEIDSNDNITLKCNKCHADFSVKFATYRRILKNEKYDPQCLPCSYPAGYIDFNEIAEKRGIFFSEKNTLDKNKITKGSAKRILLFCNNGHEWYSYAYAIADSCPRCYSVSKPEKELQEFILKTGLSVLFNDRTIIKPYELDVVVPSKKIALEFNGLYWHSGGDKYKHKEKFDLAKENGFQLITIWEDDWKNRNHLCQSMILRKMNISQEKRVNARDLVLDTSPSLSDKKDFFNTWHIQGTSRSTWTYGLKDDQGNFVAMMSFVDTGKNVVLNRFATSCIVRGGFSKLLKNFEKQHPEINEVVSFSDNCVSDGSLYHNSGFLKKANLPPDYSYLFKGKRSHKFNFRKKRFKQDSNLEYNTELTEKQLAELNGIPKIWDAGKVKWIKQNPYFP